jgi:hypothetical protein
MKCERARRAREEEHRAQRQRCDRDATNKQARGHGNLRSEKRRVVWACGKRARCVGIKWADRSLGYGRPGNEAHLIPAMVKVGKGNGKTGLMAENGREASKRHPARAISLPLAPPCSRVRLRKGMKHASTSPPSCNKPLPLYLGVHLQTW